MSAPNQAWSGFGQLSYIDSVFGLDLESRTFLACPARFERATYALEEFVAAGISIYFNDLEA